MIQLLIQIINSLTSHDSDETRMNLRVFRQYCCDHEVRYPNGSFYSTVVLASISADVSGIVVTHTRRVTSWF